MIQESSQRSESSQWQLSVGSLDFFEAGAGNSNQVKKEKKKRKKERKGMERKEKKRKRTKKKGRK